MVADKVIVETALLITGLSLLAFALNWLRERPTVGATVVIFVSLLSIAWLAALHPDDHHGNMESQKTPAERLPPAEVSYQELVKQARQHLKEKEQHGM